MRIDMPKKLKRKQRKVYLHEDVKKQIKKKSNKNLGFFLKYRTFYLILN